MLEQKGVSEAGAARALESMEEKVRVAEDRAAEAEHRADMSVVSARESAQPDFLAQFAVRNVTPLGIIQ